MKFKNDTIWLVFHEIKLCQEHEIDNSIHQNLIQDDIEIVDEDTIEGLQLSNNPEFEAWEGEVSEGKKSSMRIQSFPETQKLQILT